MSRPALVLIVIVAAHAHAAPPVTVQGVLHDPNGQPAGGPFELHFALENDAGDVVWDQLVDVTVEAGSWTTSLELDDVDLGSDQLWLAIALAGVPAEPRRAVHRLLWAHHASYAGVASALNCSGCIGAGGLAPDAVTAEQLAGGAVGADALGQGAVTGSAIAFDAVNSAAIALGTVTLSHLSTGICAEGDIIAKDDEGWSCGPVTLSQLADAVANWDSDPLDDMTQTTVMGGALKGAGNQLELADGSVTSAAIAKGAVQTAALQDGVVTSAKLAPGVVAAKHIKTESGFSLQQALVEAAAAELKALVAYFPSGWAASRNTDQAATPGPTGPWLRTGRRATFIKESDSTALKLTLSDDFRQGFGCASPSWGRLELRLDGGMTMPRCLASSYFQVDGQADKSSHMNTPLVCVITDVPKGLHDVELWAQQSNCGAGNLSSVGKRPLVLVEEVETPQFSTEGGAIKDYATGEWEPADGRKLTFTKASGDTVVRVTYADTIRADTCGEKGGGHVEVLMGGKPLAEPCLMARSSWVKDAPLARFHDPFVLTCVHTGIAAGEHEFSVRVKSEKGCGIADLGEDRGAPLLMVEELAPSAFAFSIDGGVNLYQVGSDFTETDREVEYDVPVGTKTLKVTFSDTLQAGSNCAGGQGQVAIRMDKKALSPHQCWTGVRYQAFNPVSYFQQLPVQLVCLVDAPPPGLRKFSVHVHQQTCGWMELGWGRGQHLLMVEPL